MDFISSSMPYLNEIERIDPACLAEWSLLINAAKTERTSVSRQSTRAVAHHAQARLATRRNRRCVPPYATCKRLLPQAVDSMVQGGTDQPTSAATALLSIRLACTYVQHGHLGIDGNGTQPSRCVPPSSPAADHRISNVKHCTGDVNAAPSVQQSGQLDGACSDCH